MKYRLFILIMLWLYVATPLWAAAGTEGREFWVALTIARGPEDKGTGFEPYIAVSSKSKAGEVTVTNPRTGYTITRRIPATGWLEIRDIPISEWYPFSANQQGQQSASGKTYQVGLQVSATVEVSVFTALRYEHAFDASNILPITALQSDYIVQDYPPYANGSPSTSYSVFCILATEDNTTVSITPTTPTYDGKPAGVPFTTPALKAGEVYYVVSTEGNETTAVEHSLSGTHVEALDGKKIAVFNGNICTRVPNSKSARDINYEQAMPTDYWGTEFIVTRSMRKDANRIRITAQEDDTQVFIDGHLFTTLASRETYEIELTKMAGLKGCELLQKDILVGEVLHIQTSCPCAIYSYDVGNSYAIDDKQGVSDMDNGKGDPSMTWVAPIEQKINEITFGVMGTDKTQDHFVNIVTTTKDISGMHIYQTNGNDILRAQDWLPVPSKPEYSYLRQNISITSGTGNNPIFTIKGDAGFIAHVYGNGEDESYAYSCGSAAVKRGIQLDDNIFVNDIPADVTYCVGTPIHFNAQVGTDIIDKAIWDMGDGVTFRDGRLEFDHTYDSPGWYDVKVTVYAHKECPETVYPPEDINITFRVVIPDTVRKNFFICEGEQLQYNGKTYTESTIDTAYFNCDSVVIFKLEVGEKTSSLTELTAQDSCLWNGQWYYKSGTYEWHGTNAAGCDSTAVVNLRVLTCLDMEVSSPAEVVCGDEPAVEFPFIHHKGDIGDAYLQIGNRQVPLTHINNTFVADMQHLRPYHYTDAIIMVQDPICERTLEFPVTFEVRYPNTIFAQKWDNVLAVYNETYNGGYTFKAFQWYKNGQPIEGATGSWYHSDSPLSPDDTYSVLLTTTDGHSVLSCEKNAVEKTSAAQVSVTPNILSAGETVYINTTIEGTAVLYNTLGIQQTTLPLANSATLSMPARSGVYVLQVVLDDGSAHSFRLIVN